MYRLARASLAVLLLFGFGLPASASVPLATREADRQAKAAVPSAKEALLYVYWSQQSGGGTLAVTLNGRDTVRLAPATYAFWRVQPGRVEVAAEGTASRLAFSADRGRVYYVEVTRTAAGVTNLRQVPFPVGRTQVHRAQLVGRGSAKAVRPARAEPAPAPARTRRAGNMALALKLGSFKLGEEAQSLVLSGNTFALQFDTSASSVFGLEGEYFVRPDTSFGVELVKYSNDYVTTMPVSDTGSIDTLAVLVNAKRYFLPASAWQPYIGIGVGGATIDFGGIIQGSTGGVALQVLGGVQWRSDRLALRAELKYLNADTEDDNGQKVDASGSGLFLGAGFYF